MARPAKSRGGGTRSGGAPKARTKGSTNVSKRVTPRPTPRYTPPVPRSQKVSPVWVPVLMFSCLGLGMLTILANYVSVLPGNGPSNTYLLIGLGLITAGFITATRYH